MIALTINKRLFIFNSAIIIISMLIVFVVSNNILNKTLENSAKNYLKTAVYSASYLFDSRLNKIENIATLSIELDDIAGKYLENNKEELTSSLISLEDKYDYLDYGVFIDKEGNIFSSFPNNSETSNKILMPYLELTPNETIKAQCVADINQIFHKDSPEIDKYRIFLEDQNKYYNNALMNIVMSPVLDSSNNILGYLALGEVINKSSFYPSEYSKTVPNSYLSISLGNIRICSNINSQEKNDYTGTIIPDISTRELVEENMYFGSEFAPIGDNYFFLYKPVYDYFGEFLGYLSVGIPELIFTEMLSVNKKIITSVVLISLPIILLFSSFIGKRITNPILISTNIARRISKGDFLAAKEYKITKSLSLETKELLLAIGEMADTLYKNKISIENYVNELKKKHKEATLLSEQLMELNTSLESMVDARTLELRQTVEALKESNMIKSRFLANMSHELKTPLTGNINASELLLDELFGPLNEKQTKYVKNIWLSSNQLLLLINDILDISKIDVGKTSVSLSELPVKEILEESVCVVKSMAYKKSIELVVNVVPEELKIRADKVLLKQILYNLMSNAIKFSPENSSVLITAEKYKDPKDEKEYVKVCVSDKGIGIDEKDLERVFLEFEQVDNSYSREYGGTGLGLPLSKKQVELQGGRIELISKINVGTDVIFYLPSV